MAWLYIPGTAASNSDSSLPLQGIERSVTWRGNCPSRRVLLNLWNKKSWMKRLSGLTLEPSTANRGVEKWISSLPDSRVSRSHLPGNDLASKIPDGNGLPSGVLLMKFDRDSCSWKTVQQSLPIPTLSGSSPERYPQWATGGCTGFYQVKTQMPARKVPDGGFWARPSVCGNHNRKGCSPNSGDGLSTQAKDFVLRRLEWPRPRASDINGIGFHGQGGMDLRTAAVEFVTRRKKSWPRPAARDWKSGQASLKTSQRNSRPLNEVAIDFSLQRVKEKTKNGIVSLRKTLRLNPRFVEWLMGLPIGWTEFGCSVTESYQSWLRSHSVCCMNELTEPCAPGRQGEGLKGE